MCVGIPMKVVESGFFQSICEDKDGNRHTIDTMLTGEQDVGTWLLTFLGAARDVLDEKTANQILDALTALESAMKGEVNMDMHFTDLHKREEL